MSLQPARQIHVTDFRLLRLSEDATKRILFTLGSLAIWRLGSLLPLPGINLGLYAQVLEPQSGPLLINTVVSRLSPFWLGVLPYIVAYVILHLLLVFSARLRDLRKSTPLGGQRFNQLIRVGAFFIAIYQAFGIAVGLEQVPNLVPQPGAFFRLGAVVSLVTGTMFLIWLGEQISMRGVGNGVWLIFAASYIVELPAAAVELTGLVWSGTSPAWLMAGYLALSVAFIALVVLVEGAERRLPVQSATEPSRQSNLPFLSLKIDNTNVLAPMVAFFLLYLPIALAVVLQSDDLQFTMSLARVLGRGNLIHMALFAVLIVFFVYLFTTALIDSQPSARELGPGGASTIGVSAPERMAYVEGVVVRLTFIAALYLVILFVLPEVLMAYAAAPFYLGSTTVLIPTLAALTALSNIVRDPSRPIAIGRR